MTINGTVNDRNKNGMVISVEWFNVIARFEALSLTAYKCPAGKLTIGYGHTKGVKMGDKISYEQATKFLVEDITDTYQYIRPLGELTQGQFDALVSFVFNLGATKFANSTLRRKVIANPNDPTIKKEFGRWVMCKGKVSNGLVTRRAKEAARYYE